MWQPDLSHTLQTFDVQIVKAASCCEPTSQATNRVPPSPSALMFNGQPQTNQSLGVVHASRLLPSPGERAKPARATSRLLSVRRVQPTSQATSRAPPSPSECIKRCNLENLLHASRPLPSPGEWAPPAQAASCLLSHGRRSSAKPRCISLHESLQVCLQC